MYDFLIVGAGLFGAVCAQQLKEAGFKVLVMERRDVVGGNIRTENVVGVEVHKYGAHIFHTNDDEVWEYVNRFVFFNNFVNSPIANYKGEIFSLPFNMYTFNKIWGLVTPVRVAVKIESQRQEIKRKPRNLEEQAVSLVGRDVFEKLIKGYTEKQWGKSCKDLPAFIINRIPVRFTYDNNYFNAKYQGIPVEGYTALIERLLDGIEVVCGKDFLDDKEKNLCLAKRVIYTGPVDEFFGYSLGRLEYRSLRFETEVIHGKPERAANFQGNAVVNYTGTEVPWTRIIEHKWFKFGKDKNGDDIQDTVITREFSITHEEGLEPYYPVNDKKNTALYKSYKELIDKERNVVFGGRLGSYKYYDMDVTVAEALKLADKLIAEKREE